MSFSLVMPVILDPMPPTADIDPPALAPNKVPVKASLTTLSMG